MVASAKAKTYFLSHNRGDDDIVRTLHQALTELGVAIVIDSRTFHGGDPLQTTIFDVIDHTSGVLVLVSARAKDSEWVPKELKYALKLQAERGGPNAFPVVPLLLDGTPLGAFSGYFDEEPLHVAIRSAALDEAPHAILVALRLREPTDAAPVAQPPTEPVEELVLVLTDPMLVTRTDGSRRAGAIARLVYEASTTNPRAVHGQRFRLEAPLGMIEADDLRWYLEDYAVWPTTHDRERVTRIEGQLVQWGRLLYDTALPTGATTEPLKSWSASGGQRTRRFSVEVDTAPIISTPDDAAQATQEAATLLLGLPWELLHDGRGFLFQGGSPVRVRRRVLTGQAVATAVVDTPVRVLLISPRPEDAVCGYIDHRASALPLVEATDTLADRVALRQLSPPTLPALREELDRARRAGKPYHVLHFDGHGVYDRSAGLGALCFEHEEDANKPLGPRRHARVATPELGALLRDHGISLVFLEACQAAQANSASESVASALLKTGVGSVVSMSHGVLIETARRFVQSFYSALCAGLRVGSAMLVGQNALKDNPVRGRVFGFGEFSLQDWFVPVLYQDRDDPQLFHDTPPPQAREDWRERLRTRLGALPDAPPQGFVGRSRELLALERLLAAERYAVLRGQGGEGKTALAVEFGRWRMRARQVERVVFVSVEQYGDARAVLDAIGRQLVGPAYSVATYHSQKQAAEPVLRVLRERTPTLLIVDNMESVLAPPFMDANDAAGAIAADMREAADAILALCAMLGAASETRIVFTSREALPAPFGGAMQRIELHRLHRRDAVELVERTLRLEGTDRGSDADTRHEEIEALVEAVHGHARTLALVAPALRERGPAATRCELTALMTEMELRFPGQREQSLLASVELSLRRLMPEQRQRVRVLGVFHGAVNLDMLGAMPGWQQEDSLALGAALIETGLATPEPYHYLSLNPALCPYLAAALSDSERVRLESQWFETMLAHIERLQKETHRKTTMANAMTVMELPNLLHLLSRAQAAGNAETTIGLAAALHGLLLGLGRPRQLAYIAQVCDAAGRSLAVSGWSRARFQVEHMRCQQFWANGQFDEALGFARQLHDHAAAAGKNAYLYADHDCAMAIWLHARLLKMTRNASLALPLLEEAQLLLETVERDDPDCDAAGMASTVSTERADALRDLGRLDEAAQSYKNAIAVAERLGNERQIAVNKGQLGTILLQRGDFHAALSAHIDSRKRFEALSEPSNVATAWYLIGVTHRHIGDGAAAETAYRESLARSVVLGQLTQQADTLNELGLLYANVLNRPEEAVAHFRQAAELHAERTDAAGEGRARGNLATLLGRLGRLDEARNEIGRTIRCNQGLDDAAQPWKAWGVLSAIEADAGNMYKSAAARSQASAAYLEYRRRGGEPQHDGGRLATAVGRMLVDGHASAATSLLQHVVRGPMMSTWLLPLITALQAIANGNSSPNLADAPALEYDDAVEVKLLIEQLNAAAR